jgi:hypothetical protein
VAGIVLDAVDPSRLNDPAPIAMFTVYDKIDNSDPPAAAPVGVVHVRSI